MLQNVKMAGKIGGSFIVLLAILGGLGFIAWNGVERINHSVEVLENTNQMLAQVLEGRQAQLKFAYTESEKHQQRFSQQMESISSLIDDSIKTADSSETVDNYKQVENAAQKYKTAFNEYTDSFYNQSLPSRENMQTAESNLLSAANALETSQQKQLTGSFNQAADDVRAVLNTRMDEYTAAVKLLNQIDELQLLGTDYMDSHGPELYTSIQDMAGTIETGFREMDSIVTTSANRRRLSSLKESLDNYLQSIERSRQAYLTQQTLSEQMESAAESIQSLAVEIRDNKVSAAETLGETVRTTIMIMLAAALAIGVIMAIVITLSITRSLRKGVGFAKEIAKGNLQTELHTHQKDEIGELMDAMRNMKDSMQSKAEVIHTFSEGDLTAQVEKISDVDELGESLRTMKNSLTDLIGQVINATDQVSIGADQVSEASQELSQGSTEQASSIEEVSSSITEINSQSKQNAENSAEANSLAQSARSQAIEGKQQMEQLSSAMEKITASSEQINKVVKVIDDIAFQINLLALNANVEAARAGKYGKGFAVVAEEVRTLANKSAESVQETNTMVQETIKNISAGDQAMQSTAGQLNTIIDNVEKVANFLEEITHASREQADGIEQISTALDQIDQATQSNTASSEESASSAEELASQAQQLKAIVAGFRIDRGAPLLESQTTGHTQFGGQTQPAPLTKPSSHKQPRVQNTSTTAYKNTAVSQPISNQTSQTSRAARGNNYASSETGIKPVGTGNSSSQENNSDQKASPQQQIVLDDEDFDRF